MKAEQSNEQNIENTECLDAVEQISMSSFTSASRHQFFEGAERGQILDVLPLLHLEDKNCVLIEAEQGYGKTSLAHQVYLQTAEYDYDASMLHGSELSSDDDALLVQVFGKHFKIASEALTEVEDGVGLAGLYSPEQERRFVLIVDDAQQMSEMAVTLCVEFLSVVPKKQIQIVFFSLPNTPVLLADSALQDYLGQYGHQVCLRALNSRETSDYVRFLLIAFEREDVRLSRQALSRIFQISAGVPSRIAEALVYALQDYDQQLQENEPVRSDIVPKWHLVSLSLVAAGVLALILFGNPESTKELRFSETIRGMPEKSEPPTYQAPPIQFTDIEAPQPLEPSEAVDMAHLSRQPEPVPVMPEPVIPVSEPTSSGPVSEVIEQPIVSMDSKTVSVDSKTVSVDSKTVSMDSKIAKLKAERVAREQEASLSSVPSFAGTETAMWVKGMQPDHFTLQLLGGANKNAIRAFVKENGSFRKMGYFETKHDGRPWYVVVYGDFSSREQALAAVNNLPNQLKASNPWPRSAADIQAKMR